MKFFSVVHDNSRTEHKQKYKWTPITNPKTAVIAIANHKDGCGKTTTVVNLSAEFAKCGLSIRVIDLDPQANASLYIGKKHPSEIAVTCAELLLSEIEKLPLAIRRVSNL